MLASKLNAILSPFAQLANKHALSNVYRALHITPKLIQGCAPWGILEASAQIGVQEEFWIDAANFIAVCKSLPEEEVELEIKGGGLAWSCGLADGKLALLGDLTFPEIDWSPLKQKLWEPPSTFVEALQLGSLSCGPNSMASAGVYGVVIDNRNDDISVYSSDNVTVASATGSEGNPLFPDMVTLSPDALAMFISVLKTRAVKPAKVDLAEKTIYSQAGAFKLMLRPAPALKHDLRALSAAYASRDVVADIPRERIGAFIKRASALAETRQHTYVILRVAEGALSLSFAEGAAASDEYYMVDGLEIGSDLPDIKLDAMRVARVLAHAEKVVLDHIERGVLIFYGEDPSFSYMICGSQSKG
jgi:DNA polymerase III sliding clamp (beta) subunit (PCNA family)